MPASLFGERFIARREPAWHRLGEVFPQDLELTATEALEKADLMFQVEKFPLVANINGQLMDTKSFGVFREPTHDSNEYKFFGTVGKDWTAIQPQTLGTILDPISREYPVETAGAIRDGRQIFLTLDAGESKIAGEDHNLYYLITDNRDGLGALSFAFTPVRVVCQNTLIVGLDQANVNVKLEHNKEINYNAQWYSDLFGKMLRAKDETISAMDSLATVKITNDDAMAVIMAGYPNPSKPKRVAIQDNIAPDLLGKEDLLKVINDNKAQNNQYEGQVSRVQNYRQHALELYDVFNQQHGQLAETPWAIWQAVVECEDYRKGRDSSYNILVGDRAPSKMRAFKKALSLV